jgi:protein transport protein SEC20
MTEAGETSDLDTELTRREVDIRQLIQDFSLCSTFKEVDQLNGLIRTEMDKMRTGLSRLELLALEQVDLEEGERLRQQAGRHREQLASCQRQFRQANVKAMTMLETQSARDLFQSNKLGSPSVRQRRDKEQLVTEHGAVTQNLQAISRQLADTVERSRQTVGNLEGSSRTVEEVTEEHRTMAGVIGQSRRLITKYARREFTDKVLILFAFAFFFAVVLYILRKRLFPTFGPLEVIIYLLGSTGNLVSSITSLFT